MLSSLLLLSALATPPCDEGIRQDALELEGLPTNGVIPVERFEPLDATLALIDDDTQETVGIRIQEYGESTRRATLLTPQQALAPRRAYRIQHRGELAPATEVRFTTGDGPETLDAGTTEGLTSVTPFSGRTDGFRGVELNVPFGDEEAAFYEVEMRRHNGWTSTHLAFSDSLFLGDSSCGTTSSIPRDQPLTFRTRGVSLTGETTEWVDWPEEVFVPGRGCGCSGGGSHGPWWLLALLAWRRRQSPGMRPSL